METSVLMKALEEEVSEVLAGLVDEGIGPASARAAPPRMGTMYFIAVRGKCWWKVVKSSWSQSWWYKKRGREFPRSGGPAFM